MNVDYKDGRQERKKKVYQSLWVTTGPQLLRNKKPPYCPTLQCLQRMLVTFYNVRV